MGKLGLGQGARLVSQVSPVWVLPTAPPSLTETESSRATRLMPQYLSPVARAHCGSRDRYATATRPGTLRYARSAGGLKRKSNDAPASQREDGAGNRAYLCGPVLSAVAIVA